jgi:hypothetical protein
MVPQIHVNLLLTKVPGCVSRNAKTLGLQDLQFPDVAASSVPPDGTCMIYHRTDELLVEQHTVSDRQSASHVKKRAKHAHSLSCFSSCLIGVYRRSQLCISSDLKIPLFRPIVLALPENGLVWAFGWVSQSNKEYSDAVKFQPNESSGSRHEACGQTDMAISICVHFMHIVKRTHNKP